MITCAEASPLIELELDGELDPRSILEVSGHLAQCPACARQAASLRALGEAARAHLPRYEIPAALERRLRAPFRARRGPWLAAGLAAAAAAAVLVAAPQRRDGLVEESVSAHLRALQLDHATDVASSDRHTVKPWFEGKVGFAVPVRDYAGEGYPLAGGRLEILEGHAAAALVYRHGAHLLNLLVVDAHGAPDAGVRRDDLRAFHVFRWTRGGLGYLLVGDVAEAEMATLAARMAEPGP